MSTDTQGGANVKHREISYMCKHLGVAGAVTQHLENRKCTVVRIIVCGTQTHTPDTDPETHWCP